MVGGEKQRKKKASGLISLEAQLNGSAEINTTQEFHLLVIIGESDLSGETSEALHLD